jgi:K+-sensing histidine kinase KdpD
LRDISDLIKGEYARSIEKISEMMIASTSHDMRTPLNAIVQMHKMLEKRLTDPKSLEWLKIANTSTSLLMFLVNDTLDYFQIKSGKFVKMDKSFRIKNLVENTFELISH